MSHQALVQNGLANKHLFIANYCPMYQINNIQHVRFIHCVCHIYYIYLRYSARCIWCKTSFLQMVFYGGMCEINSAMCVFVWLIYRAYKVMFIGPAQIIKRWTFKCNIHLMQKQDGWKYYLVTLELSPKSKSQIIYIHKSVLKTSHLTEVHIPTGRSERNVGGGRCCCSAHLLLFSQTCVSVHWQTFTQTS